jgi:hypothetical protein
MLPDVWLQTTAQENIHERERETWHLRACGRVVQAAFMGYGRSACRESIGLSGC